MAKNICYTLMMTASAGSPPVAGGNIQEIEDVDDNKRTSGGNGGQL